MNPDQWIEYAQTERKKGVESGFAIAIAAIETATPADVPGVDAVSLGIVKGVVKRARARWRDE